MAKWRNCKEFSMCAPDVCVEMLKNKVCEAVGVKWSDARNAAVHRIERHVGHWMAGSTGLWVEIESDWRFHGYGIGVVELKDLIEGDTLFDQ
nr:hypothetical protein [Nocardia canadensis]